MLDTHDEKHIQVCLQIRRFECVFSGMHICSILKFWLLEIRIGCHRVSQTRYTRAPTMSANVQAEVFYCTRTYSHLLVL